MDEKRHPVRGACCAIKTKIAWFQDSVLNEAGLPKVYSVYRDILESATKIVKEFDKKRIQKKEQIS